MRGKTILGCVMGSNRFRVGHAALRRALPERQLRLDEMISARLPLERVNEAFDALRAGDRGAERDRVHRRLAGCRRDALRPLASRSERSSPAARDRRVRTRRAAFARPRPDDRARDVRGVRRGVGNRGAACGLVDGTVYHYWFEVPETEPFRAVHGIMRCTDPTAWAVDWRLRANEGEDEAAAAVVRFADGRLVPTDAASAPSRSPRTTSRWRRCPRTSAS
jgi:hypothetical protein